MKLHTDNEQFEGIVPSARMEFKISSSPHMFKILSDSIYRDKISAVIRELSCNAHDAHVDAKQQKPFRVQIPTQIEPTFSVEDEGTGINPNEIADIFWTYGTSSKTGNNDTIGALGLGSKSPFAYTKSSFTVKNRFAGNEHTYFCFINEHGTPDGSEILVEPTSKPSGITVELAVRNEDINAFETRIKRFFKNWPVRPEFIGRKLEIPAPTQAIKGTNWYYEHVAHDHDVENRSIALMGNVSYPIDLGSVPKASPALQFIAANSFRITFPLGALSFQASREELSYEEHTVAALEAAAKLVVQELRQSVHDAIEVDAKSSYALWLAYHDKIAQVKFKRADLIGKLFANETVFKTTTGVSLMAKTLDKSEQDLVVKGLSQLAIFETIKSNGITSLKNKRLVVMTKAHPTNLDPDRVLTKTANWYSSTLQPRVTHFGNQPADYLINGYIPQETLMTIPRTPGMLMFIINDIGSRGRDAARLLARLYSFYFVDLPLKGTIGAAEQELTEMLKGTLLEGMQIGLLSKQPGFVMPVAAVSTSTGPAKPRGHIEVRFIDPYKRHTPYYENVDPKTLTAYYITTSKNDAEYYNEVVVKLLAILENDVGQFKDVKFICRNDEDITLLRKKGATLTHVKDMITDAMRKELTDALCIVRTKELFHTNNDSLLADICQQRSLLKQINHASPLLTLIADYKAANVASSAKIERLAHAAKLLSISVIAKLTAPIDFNKKLLARYPLFAVMNLSQYNSKLHLHQNIDAVVEYVDFIDKNKI